MSGPIQHVSLLRFAGRLFCVVCEWNTDVNICSDTRLVIVSGTYITDLSGVVQGVRLSEQLAYGLLACGYSIVRIRPVGQQQPQPLPVPKEDLPALMDRVLETSLRARPARGCGTKWVFIGLSYGGYALVSEMHRLAADALVVINANYRSLEDLARWQEAGKMCGIATTSSCCKEVVSWEQMEGPIADALRTSCRHPPILYIAGSSDRAIPRADRELWQLMIANLGKPSQFVVFDVDHACVNESVAGLQRHSMNVRIDSRSVLCIHEWLCSVLEQDSVG